jgi:hypothetical protein
VTIVKATDAVASLLTHLLTHHVAIERREAGEPEPRSLPIGRALADSAAAIDHFLMVSSLTSFSPILRVVS